MGKWKQAISRLETAPGERNVRCRKGSLGPSREPSLVLMRHLLQKCRRVEFHHFGPYSVGRCSTCGCSLPSKLEPSHNDIMEMAGIKFGAPTASAAEMGPGGISCFRVIFSRSVLHRYRSRTRKTGTDRKHSTSTRRGANRKSHSSCIAKVRPPGILA